MFKCNRDAYKQYDIFYIKWVLACLYPHTLWTQVLLHRLEDCPTPTRNKRYQEQDIHRDIQLDHRGIKG